ncbi:MAG TPA: hypothetical protein VNP93_05155 [Gaiellaceae bacterium]|nr:hypothetical protein [Gaiellaceae bacterium]
MRKYILLLLACLLAVPALASAALMRGTGDGTLSVEDGQGRIVIDVRGGVIGRFDRGFVTILDRTPEDAFEPKVWGATREVVIGLEQERHFGPDVRFRLIGGSFRIVVNGAGIDLSAVGTGVVSLEGSGPFPGVYSLDGEDCDAPRSKCKVLPNPAQRFRLGTPEPPEKAAPSRANG